MAFGLPSVSFDPAETRVSGADTVLYVPSGDIMAFADAVERLIDDPALRADLGRRARERVASVLDWSPQSEAYVGVYDELTGRPPSTLPQTGDTSRTSTDPQGRRYVDLGDAVAFDRYLVERRAP